MIMMKNNLHVTIEAHYHQSFVDCHIRSLVEHLQQSSSQVDIVHQIQSSRPEQTTLQ